MWKATALVLVLSNLDINMIMWMSLFLQCFKLSQGFQGQPIFLGKYTHRLVSVISLPHSTLRHWGLGGYIWSSQVQSDFFFLFFFFPYRFYLQRKSCKCGVIVPSSSICLGLQPAWQSACSQQLFVPNQEANCCSGGKGLFHFPSPGAADLDWL